LARAGQVRQADDELPRIKISEADIAPLLAFLNALNEDLRYNTTRSSERGEHIEIER
jgi:hypothetical protein